MLLAQTYSALVAAPTLAHLSVSVLDMQSAYLSDVSIRLQSKSVIREQVAQVGLFNLDLPGGEYIITVNAGLSYFQYQQKGLKLGWEDKKALIIRPVPHAPSDQASIPDPAMINKVLFLDLMARGSRFGKIGNRVTVWGPYAMVGMQSLFIYAPKINCDSSSYRCKADHVTLVDLGSRTFYPRSVSLDATTRKLQLKLRKTVEEVSLQ